MNKLISKIVGVCLGLSLATGVGVGVVMGTNKSIEPAYAYDYNETALGDLTDGAVGVLVGNNGSNYAMTNNNGTGSAPAASSVTIANDKITSNVGNTLLWEVSKTDSNLKFKVPGTSNYLYCTNTNNGVRVGTNSNNVFTVDGNSGYLKNSATNRYVGIYNSQDWRCYTSSGGNIASQTFKFYVQSAGGTSVTGVSLDKTYAYSRLGGSNITLTATVEPSTAVDKSVTWSSTSPSVATVSDGVVTLGGAGFTTITATTTDGGFTASCEVLILATDEGLLDDEPLTIAEAIHIAKTLDSEETTSSKFYISGTVSSIRDAYSDEHGNISLNFVSNAETFVGYRLNTTAEYAASIVAGTTVVLFQGFITNYRGTYETAAGGDILTGTTYPEPSLVVGTLSDLFANTDGNFKQLYQVTGYVSAWKDGEEDGTAYGNFYLTETEGGATEYYVYGATATASALEWNENSGVFVFTNPQDFLTDDLTKNIQIGSLLTIKLTRSDHNSNPEAKGIIVDVQNPAISEMILEPEYLGISSELTTETTLTGSDGTTYKTAPAGSSNKVKSQALGSGAANALDSTKATILIGKNGAYLYNTSAYERKISSLSVYSNKGGSASVQVAVEFAEEEDGPITSSIASSTNVKTLSVVDSVYDFSLSGMLDASYKYFRLQVVSNHNAQIQIKLTFADDEQEAGTLNSITLSHPDLSAGVLPIGKGASKTLSVTYDPDDDPTVDKTLTWSTSNDEIATVVDGTITVSKTAALNSTATITATPTDTHASAKSITVQVVAPVAKTVDMRNGFTNNSDSRLELITTQGLSSWPANAIKVTLTDDSVIYPSYDDVKIQWYYNPSDDKTNNETLIDDISSFLFTTSMKRMRLSYDGVMATARTFITVVEATSNVTDFADLFLDMLSTGSSAVCDADGNTDVDTLQMAWEMLAEEYDELSSSDKAIFESGRADEGGSNIQRALALYDYIAAKYNTQLESATLTDYNFIGRTITVGANPRISPINVNNNTVVVVIIVATVLTATTVGAYFFLRKKKEEK